MPHQYLSVIRDVSQIIEVTLSVVYYESIKRDYAPHLHWVARGTGTTKDRDDVNRRDVCECDG